MAKNKQPESELQRACVRWFRMQYPEYLIFAIPNGGYRSAIQAAIMKGEGVMAGIPDLQVCLPGRTFFIEMKSEHGRMTDAQKQMCLKLRELGHTVYVVSSFDAFVETVRGEVARNVPQCRQIRILPE